jgi:hypothetical protein
VKKIPAVLAFVLGLAACGGNSQTTATATGVSPAEQTAALSYLATGADMSGVIDQYRAATATIRDLNSCQAVEAAYRATMGPIIDQMTTVSAPMDRYMSGAMGPAVADMGCVAAAMKTEFARHAAVACSAPDTTANQAEAVQHATTMAGWADHQRVRYEQMGSAVGMMPAAADSTWTCTHNADGSFTMNGHPWSVPQGSTPPMPPPSTTPPSTTTTSPWPMPCGGMMVPCNGYGYPPSTIPPSTTSTIPPPTTTPPSTTTTMPCGGMMSPCTPPTTTTTTTAPPATGDSLVLGQRIFMSGIGVNGQPLARTGGLGMMMVSGCASCHGVDGHGLRTMMLTTPNITYVNLTNPAGMLDPDGSRGPTYTDDLIRRAVTQGIDAAGDPLSTAMPHWQLRDDDWADLLLFLKTLP